MVFTPTLNVLCAPEYRLVSVPVTCFAANRIGCQTSNFYSIFSMEFCYAAVLRDDIPLVQHCPKPGNFDIFYQKFCERNTITPGRTIIQCDGFHWGIQLETTGLTFLCVIKQPKDQTVLEKSLEDIKSRFLRLYASSWKTSAPFSLQTSFEPQLERVKQSIETWFRVEEQSIIELSASGEQEALINERPSISVLSTLGSNARKRRMKKTLVACSVAILLLVIYLALVMICGGWDLTPKC